MGADSDDIIANYDPDLPPLAWATISAFVRSAAADAIAHVPYPTNAVINAVAHHVDWCVNVASVPMSRESVFRRDVIAAAIAVMPTTQSSTRGRRRSLLFRVSEALGVTVALPPLPPLAAATPTAPYTGLEIEQINEWAYTQDSANQRHARALVALGLGAGLPTRNIARLRATDVHRDGYELYVDGTTPRIVPVRDEWADELRELALLAYDRNAPLYRPGVAWTKNIVTTFVARSRDAGIRPSAQRMRSTWLVHHLATGMPMQDLLSAAGLVSMDALVRYEQFLPPQARAAHADTTR